MRRVAIMMAAIASTLALPAAAQDRPPLTPTRDVSVTYRAEGGGPNSGEMRLSWLNAEKKMRMDLPGGAGWSLTDMRSGQVVMVMEAQRMVMELPRDPSSANPAQPSPTARFTRGGTETVLGHRCTVWRYEDGEHRGEACVTAEGIMLRSQASSGGHRGSMTATEVAFGPQDPARFRVPAGYRSMQMPGMPNSGGGPPSR